MYNAHLYFFLILAKKYSTLKLTAWLKVYLFKLLELKSENNGPTGSSTTETPPGYTESD